MARGINPSRLANVIQKLQSERQSYQQRIDEIDAIFVQCGILPTTTSAKRRGRPPKSAVATVAAGTGRRGRRRRRGRFGKPATQSLLEFVKQAGRGGAASSAISKHWKSEGRAGEPYITLGHLVKAGSLKKKSLQGQRGSQYFVA